MAKNQERNNPENSTENSPSANAEQVLKTLQELGLSIQEALKQGAITPEEAEVVERLSRKEKKRLITEDQAKRRKKRLEEEAREKEKAEEKIRLEKIKKEQQIEEAAYDRAAQEWVDKLRKEFTEVFATETFGKDEVAAFQKRWDAEERRREAGEKPEREDMWMLRIHLDNSLISSRYFRMKSAAKKIIDKYKKEIEVWSNVQRDPSFGTYGCTSITLVLLIEKKLEALAMKLEPLEGVRGGKPGGSGDDGGPGPGGNFMRAGLD